MATDGSVQVHFVSGFWGRFGASPYLVKAFGGVQVCSDLFRFVRCARGELKREVGVARGSCLRRNDGRWLLGASHPPPSLPPKRGEG